MSLFDFWREGEKLNFSSSKFSDVDLWNPFYVPIFNSRGGGLLCDCGEDILLEFIFIILFLSLFFYY